MTRMVIAFPTQPGRAPAAQAQLEELQRQLIVAGIEHTPELQAALQVLTQAIRHPHQPVERPYIPY